MPGGNLNKEIFLNTVKSDAANGTANAVAMLKRSCPELSDAHCEDIIGTIIGAMNMSEADKVSLVVTAPPSFSINRENYDECGSVYDKRSGTGIS